MNPTDTTIVRCSACGAANRIPASKTGVTAKCGKCHAALYKEESKTASTDVFKMRCSECGAKNRIPGAKLDAGPKCGKCGSLLQTEDLFAPQPVIVTEGNFDTQVLKSPLPVLLFAWAPWCSTCGAVTPILEEFASNSKGKVRVGKLNVDANPTLASKFNILSVPFLFIFDNGQLKERLPGTLQKHEIMMKMAAYI